jgi:cell division protease FtsH
VEKVSIISRGRAGGMTWFVPEGEQAMVTSSQLRSRVTALLGGRAAEELLVSEVSSAAEDDLERATKLARWMVARLGMSDLGPISVGGQDGADGTVPPPSDELVARIDGAAAKLLEDAGAHAGELLRRHRPSLEALVAKLVEDESVEGADLRAMLASIIGAPADDVVAALEADTATPADETRAAT